ncbi:MAG: DUF6062 family protein [Armatimonadota bacterium]|nr:DUF6062 family protein [Armatimonadota bacterium]MDR7452780.1 DUF6062 family protein [Armatimonadota bacterium]MDR7468335.1 DUF6062 family protein [Armatimonadota bacterium]MDR7495272.1 DUF6062 family protein [Armatimonadota bacterium]MDR7500514.1 DUF6062 family protein [Armatimonadota bacterium]
MTRPPERADTDLVFARVEEALAAGGCPICRIGDESAARFLWGYLYERVNDPASRRELIDSRGFCARHAWALVPLRDTMGVAILYRHLLQDLAAGIRRAAASRPRRARSSLRLRAALRPSGECPACLHVRTMEDGALHALLPRIARAEVWERLCGPSALCLPHFLRAVSLADERTAARLIDAELAALDDLGRHLDELIRKHDYRFSAEPIAPEEAASWMRAIELLVGAEGRTASSFRRAKTNPRSDRPGESS